MEQANGIKRGGGVKWMNLKEKRTSDARGSSTCMV
jgi:hypothetical protein